MKSKARATKTNLQVEALEQRQLLAADLAAVADDSPTPALVADEAAAPSTSIAALDETAEVAVTLPEQLGEQATVGLEVNGESFTLELERYSVRSENFKVVLHHADGTVTEFDAGEDKTYRGTITELPGVEVRALAASTGLEVTAINSLSGEVLWMLEPSADGYVVVLPIATPHDHDGDGVADHTADEHDAGCCCEACLGVAPAVTPAEAVQVQPMTDAAIAAPATSGDETVEPAAANAVVLNPITIKQAEIAFDVTFEAFSNHYGSNVQAVMDNINRFMSATEEARLNTIWVRDALVEHVLGRVEIRMSAASDPYLQQGLSGRSGTDRDTLDAFRAEWQSGAYGTTHDLAHMITKGGGGLAWVGTAAGNNSRRYSQGGGDNGFGANPTDFWRGIARHEVGHTWGLNHGHGGIDFSGPDANGEFNSGTAFGIMRGGLNNRMTPTEVATVTARRDAVAGTLTDTGQGYDANVNIRPYAALDTFELAAPAAGNPTYMLDVLDNDYDANNDPLYLSGVGGARFGSTFTMASGSVLAIGDGLGDRGQDVLLYTPGPGVTQETVYYFARDSRASNSLDNFGQANITIDNPEITVNLGLDSYAYDAGTRESPVFNSGVQATQLSPDTFGDVNWSDPVQAVDRATPGQNAYNRDLVFGTTPVTLSHALQNGRWRVTVNMSDPETNLDNMYVTGEGLPGLSNLDRPIGQNQTVSFEVDVLDGELNLEFGDADAVNPQWALNRVVLTQLEEFLPPVVEGDYNNNGVVNAADYVLFRDTVGQAVANPFDEADGNGSRTIDLGDYHVFAANFGAELVNTVLIDATTGNGEFAVDNVGDVSFFGGGAGEPDIGLNRDRALRGSSSGGHGISVLGWDIQRVAYPGGNDAFGVDGNYGFATNAGPGPGQTGQAFVNSGEVTVTSDTVLGDFAAGDRIDLSYLLGSDTGGATATVEADVSLIFDQGLVTERTHTFSTRTGTGLSMVPLTEQHRLTLPASSVTVRFNLDGGNGVRTLLDGVELTAVSSSTNGPSLGAYPEGEHDHDHHEEETHHRVLLDRYTPLPRPEESTAPVAEPAVAAVAGNELLLFETLGAAVIVDEDLTALASDAEGETDSAFETLVIELDVL